MSPKGGKKESRNWKKRRRLNNRNAQDSETVKSTKPLGHKRLNISKNAPREKRELKRPTITEKKAEPAPV